MSHEQEQTAELLWSHIERLKAGDTPLAAGTKDPEQLLPLATGLHTLFLSSPQDHQAEARERLLGAITADLPTPEAHSARRLRPALLVLALLLVIVAAGASLWFYNTSRSSAAILSPNPIEECHPKSAAIENAPAITKP